LELDNFRRLRHSGRVEKPPIIQTLPAVPKKKKRGLWIVILAVVLVAAALSVVVLVKRATPPITVQTTKVSRHKSPSARK
jgi:flagellar basal body-associated protein FliL